jgi:hypothetical protein
VRETGHSDPLVSRCRCVEISTSARRWPFAERCHITSTVAFEAGFPAPA